MSGIAESLYSYNTAWFMASKTDEESINTGYTSVTDTESHITTYLYDDMVK